MLSIFPSLYQYELLAPTLLRLVLALVLIYWSYRSFRTSPSNITHRAIATLEGLSGILLIIGLWTQVIALIISIDLLIKILGRLKNRSLLTDGINYYLILFTISMSLLFLGAGLFALDMPI